MDLLNSFQAVTPNNIRLHGTPYCLTNHVPREYYSICSHVKEVYNTCRLQANTRINWDLCIFDTLDFYKLEIASIQKFTPLEAI